VLEGIPRLVLPTRWEQLQPKIEGNDVSLRTIINPVHEAMDVIRDIVEYLQTTGGCQVLVLRADTGSGKTTFLNTLPHYMRDIDFRTQTMDLQTLSEDDFGKQLWNIPI
jgi:ABC-type transport system involved in cytochrome bd biosynthesis fused ATPase/permease subunit